MKRAGCALAALCSILAGTIGADATTIPPSTLQSLVNALSWTNGHGLLTGADMQALWNTDIQIFETWALGIPNLGTGVATLLDNPASGTGGPVGSISPTFTGLPVIPGLPGLSLNVEGGGAPGLDMPGCSTEVTCAWEIFASPTGYPVANQPTLFVTKVAPASGGTLGNTYSAIEAQQTTGLSDPGFQWALQSILHERTLVAEQSQNVAIVGTVFKELNGQSAGTQIGHFDAGLFAQCVDQTAVVNPTGSCEGGEIDVLPVVGGGTDTNKQRLILSLIAGVQNGNDTGVHIGVGLAIGAQAGAVIDTAIDLRDNSTADLFRVFGNGGTQINSNLGGWSSVNAGKQLIVMPETSAATNPAIGISDTNSTNFIALENLTGTLIIQGMPALADSSTAPTVFMGINSTDVTVDEGLIVSGAVSGENLTLADIAGGNLPSLFVTTANRNVYTSPGAEIVARVDYGSFGDANTTFGFVVVGGKNVDTASTTGSWQLGAFRYTGFGGGDSSSQLTAGQELMAPVASTNNNSGRYFGNNPECAIPTGMSPVECTGEEIDLQTLSSPSSDRHGLRIVDVGSTGSHATDDSGLSILATGIGWTSVLEFGSAGGNFPGVAGGTLIKSAASSAVLAAIADFSSLTGANPGILFSVNNASLYFGGSAWPGGRLESATATGGPDIKYGSGFIVINTNADAAQIASFGSTASTINAPLVLPGTPTSAGSGGLNVCIDTSGNLYKKATCP